MATSACEMQFSSVHEPPPCDAATLWNMVNQQSMVALTGLAGDIQHVNDRFVRVSGYPRDALLGQNHRILSSGTHSDAFWAEMWQILLRGLPWAGVVCNQSRSGTEYWVDMQITPLLNAHGNVERYLSIQTDITAQKQTQDERESATNNDVPNLQKQYLRATLDNLPFSFWLKDEAGRYLAANKAFADACGQSQAESVVGLDDRDLWPSGIATRYRAIDLRVMRSRLEETRIDAWEDQGKKRWMETFVKPLFSGSGAVVGTVGYGRDVTDQATVQHALAQSEQRWELAMRGTNDGIWDLSPATGHVYYSPRSKEMLGYDEADISTHVDEWISRLHPEDSDRVRLEMRRHLARETEQYQMEYRIRCKDETYKWVLARGRAVFNSQGEPVRMLGSHTDVTDRKHAEEQLRDYTEQLTAIFDLSPDGFISFDGDRRVRYASPGFVRMSGMQLREVLGLHEDQLARVISARCAPE